MSLPLFITFSIAWGILVCSKCEAEFEFDFEACGDGRGCETTCFSFNFLISAFASANSAFSFSTSDSTTLNHHQYFYSQDTVASPFLRSFMISGECKVVKTPPLMVVLLALRNMMFVRGG
jgi:hypothetical protein